ncbi:MULTISPECIES: hypothetical protein [unclassified Streptomyces]|uniref:hypothetical protein n=1 Tax=unclassified Streptomyces TaxID=2593676 RepID=UPI0033303174
MKDKKHDTETAADEVLREFEDAETNLDDGERDSNDREAADALSTSEEAQESARKDRGPSTGH